MHVSSILVTHVVLVLMVLPKFLSLIPFWRAGPALVLECYGSTELRAEVIQKVQEHIWPLVAAKKFRPVVANTFPLEKAVWAP
jgi:hypothetical protein